MNAEALLADAADKNASDIYIISGKPVTFRIYGKLVSCNDEILKPCDTERFLREIYLTCDKRDFSKAESGDDDFAVSLPGVSRFRVNAYLQRSDYACVIRLIPHVIPNPADINIPDTIMRLSDNLSGIILFSGTTGSGKTTSLACLIDAINTARENHIVTIEDPIEYLHQHKRSIISQRELGSDTQSYKTALKAAMRQAPDVILVGEMRDRDTISAAVTAAETGHLVISTLHTAGAAATIDRIIDVFPADQQNQIRTQLSMTLRAVVSQQLIPALDGGLYPAFEIMLANSAIKNLIRDNKVFQIDNIIQTSAAQGMRTMDTSLIELFRKKIISKENAVLHSVNQQNIASRLVHN